MTSICSDEEIDWNMRYYDMEGIWARPLDLKCPHICHYGKNFKIPCIVTSPKLISLDVGAPLYPYLRDIIEMIDVAPIQLSPNSYKLVLALFMLYSDLDFPAPTMKEVSHFFSLIKSDNGYHYLVVDKQHNKKGFSVGKIRHIKKLKEHFLYLYMTFHESEFNSMMIEVRRALSHF